jgi:hypothetical protein
MRHSQNPHKLSHVRYATNLSQNHERQEIKYSLDKMTQIYVHSHTVQYRYEGYSHNTHGYSTRPWVQYTSMGTIHVYGFSTQVGTTHAIHVGLNHGEREWLLV